MRLNSCVFLSVAAAGGIAWAQGLTGQVTIVTAPAGARVPLRERAPVQAGSRVQTVAENRAAVHLTAGEGPAAQVSLYLEAECEMQIPAETSEPARHVVAQRGSCLVHYLARTGDRTPLVVSAPAGPDWVRIEPGTLIWFQAGADAERYRLVEGSATRFEGPPPAGDPSQAAGGTPLAARPELRQSAEALIDGLVEARTLAAGMSWILRASEGDLVPPPRGMRPLDVAQAQVRVSIVPRAATPSAATQLPVSLTTTPAVSQAQSLLTSQSPASVVVGARLERTRIVGNPGTPSGGTGIRFNSQVRGPLNLSPGR